MSTALMTTESQGQTLIGDFGDWTAFTDGSGKNKVCYIASEPKKETGNYKRRGNVYVLVTHRPAEKIQIAALLGRVMQRWIVRFLE